MASAVSEFFGGFARFGCGLERDAKELRHRVEAPASHEGPERLLRCVAGMEKEAAGMAGEVNALMQDERHAVLLSDLLLACVASYEHLGANLAAVEDELVQYGFAKPAPAGRQSEAKSAERPAPAQPEATNSAAAEQVENAGPQEAAAADTPVVDSVPADADARAEGAEPEAEASGTVGEEDGPANDAQAEAADVGIDDSQTAEEAPAPAVTSAKEEPGTQPTVSSPQKPGLLPALAPATPRTPSLDDFGLSAATLQVLQTARSMPPPMMPALDTASTGAGAAAVSSATDAGNAMLPGAEDDVDLDDSIDATVFGITSVQLLGDWNAAAPQHQPEQRPVRPEPIAAVTPAAAAPVHHQAPAPAAESPGDQVSQFSLVSEAEFKSLPAYITEKLVLMDTNRKLLQLIQLVAQEEEPAAVKFTQQNLLDALGGDFNVRAFLLVLIKLRRFKGCGNSEAGEMLYCLQAT